MYTVGNGAKFAKTRVFLQICNISQHDGVLSISPIARDCDSDMLSK